MRAHRLDFYTLRSVLPALSVDFNAGRAVGLIVTVVSFAIPEMSTVISFRASLVINTTGRRKRFRTVDSRRPRYAYILYLITD